MNSWRPCQPRNLRYCIKLLRTNTSLPATWIKKGHKEQSCRKIKTVNDLYLGKAKMEKSFEAFSLHHEGRSTLSHSHYCLICTCRWTFRIRVYIFHINPPLSKHKSRILLRTKEKFMMQFHVSSWVPFYGWEGRRRIPFQYHCKRVFTDYSFWLFGQ